MASVVAQARARAPFLTCRVRCGAPQSAYFSSLRSGSFDVTVHDEGDPGTSSFRKFFRDASGRVISPWHDIRLHGAQPGIFNCVVEIPKFTRPKMEVNITERHNPIAQDVKKGRLRNYHGPIFWNYGMMPQTWENPNEVHSATGCAGDGDPLDVVEIGSKALSCGAVVPVKPLGVLAMIDDGELDWKVLAISTDDPLAQELHDVGDVDAKCPGVTSGIREWFRWYKTPDGKPLSRFGFEERFLERSFALSVISENYETWKALRDGSAEAGKVWTSAEGS